MKKRAKKNKGLFDHKFVIKYDENLDKVNVEEWGAKKLAEANKALRRMKGLPK